VSEQRSEALADYIEQLRRELRESHAYAERLSLRANDAERHLTEAQQRIQALEQARAWQPVATMPATGDFVVTDGDGISIGRVVAKFSTFSVAGTVGGMATGYRFTEPTHWAPLPAPLDPTE